MKDSPNYWYYISNAVIFWKIEAKFMHVRKLYFGDHLKRTNTWIWCNIEKSAQNSTWIFLCSCFFVHFYLWNTGLETEVETRRDFPPPLPDFIWKFFCQACCFSRAHTPLSENSIKFFHCFVEGHFSRLYAKTQTGLYHRFFKQVVNLSCYTIICQYVNLWLRF